MSDQEWVRDEEAEQATEPEETDEDVEAHGQGGKGNTYSPGDPLPPASA